MRQDKFFKDMVDTLVIFSSEDEELKEKLQWCDEQAKKKGVSFYDYVFYVLHRHDADIKAEEWFKNRN